MEKPMNRLEHRLETFITETTKGLDNQPFFYAWDHDQGRWRKASKQDTVWDMESESLHIAYIDDDSYAADFVIRHNLENWGHGSES